MACVQRFQDSLHLCEESVGPAQGGESSGGVVDTETVNADAGAGGAVLLEAEQVQQEEEARAVAEFTSPCEQESAVATQPSDLDALDLPFLYHLLVVLDTLAMRNPDQLFYRKARAIALIEAGLSRVCPESPTYPSPACHPFHVPSVVLHSRTTIPPKHHPRNSASTFFMSAETGTQLHNRVHHVMVHANRHLGRMSC